MNYSKYISFPEFHPVCDIMAEQDNYWTTFIPNECFLSILDDMIKSLQSYQSIEHKSFWIQGSFGCGKSHAAMVIKHLLCDDFDDIAEHARRIADSEERYARLKNLRNSKRYLPVMLKGAEKAHSVHGASNYIKTGVKKALEKHGVNHQLMTDFDRFVQLLKDARHRWEDILFANDSELTYYSDSVEEVIKQLENGDIKYLEMVEQAVAKANFTSSSDSESIVEWLRQAEQEVKSNGYAGIIIFWDEMTSLFSGNQLDEAVLELLQKIAELTFSPNSNSTSDIYLYLISHKKLSDENMNKIKDRFIRKEYTMELVTTYYILSHLIGKKAVGLQEEKRKFRSRPDVRELLVDIEEASHSNVQGRTFLDSLFPLHPYSAYLCTIIAKNFESANRSVFKFIYDDEKGFNAFVQQGQVPETCTSDYLWRFFEESFRENDALYGDVISLFDRHNRTLKENRFVNSVFQVVLLLNALSKRATGSSLAEPSEINIYRAFAGTYTKDDVTHALNIIQELDIVSRDASGFYVVESSALPREDIVNQEKTLLRSYSTCAKILCDPDFAEIGNTFASQIPAGILRDKVFEVHDVTTPQSKSALFKSLNNFQSGYKLKLILLPCLEGMIEDTKRVCMEEVEEKIADKNVVLIIPREFLPQKTYTEWIRYKAKQAVAARRGFKADEESARRNAKLLIERWSDDLLGSSFFLFFGLGRPVDAATSYEVVDVINHQKLKPLFLYGGEQYAGLANRKNEWKEAQNAKEVITAVLESSSRDELLSKIPVRFAALKHILRASDNVDIVGPNLAFTANCPENAPIKVIKTRVDSILKKQRKLGNFNIADALSELTKPPYGLYRNAISQFIIAFCLRDYKNAFYFTSSGYAVSTSALGDQVIKAMFCKWDGSDSDKKKHTDIRFGSEDERAFNEKVTQLFGIEVSLNNTQHVLRTIKIEFAIRVGAPLWVLKYLPSLSEDVKAAYSELVKFIFDNSGASSSQADYKGINTLLSKNLVDIQRIISPENYALAFETFIKDTLANGDIFEYSFQEIREYLDARMSGEIGLWEEVETENKLLKYRPATEITPLPVGPIEPTGTGGPFKPIIDLPPAPELENNLIETIQNKRLSVDKYITCLTLLAQRYPDIRQYLFAIYENEGN